MKHFLGGIEDIGPLTQMWGVTDTKPAKYKTFHLCIDRDPLSMK